MKRYFSILILLLITLALFSCGDSNPNAPRDNQTHPATWLQIHPEAAQASDNYNSCRVCHGADLTGLSTASSCYACHFGPDGSRTPPGTNWTHATGSHADLATYEEVCNTCHSLLRSAENGPGTCHDCHGQEIPHPIGEPWLNPAHIGFHGDAAKEIGAECTVCHGLDYSGGLSGISCDICHFGPNGSRVPAGVNWVHGVSAHDTLDPYGNTCIKCHDLMSSYNGNPSCHNCH